MENWSTHRYTLIAIAFSFLKACAPQPHLGPARAAAHLVPPAPALNTPALLARQMAIRADRQGAIRRLPPASCDDLLRVIPIGNVGNDPPELTYIGAGYPYLTPQEAWCLDARDEVRTWRGPGVPPASWRGVIPGALPPVR